MKLHGIDLDPIGCRVCFHVEKDGDFEPESMAAWLGAISPGDTVIDCGAYTGLYAIAAAVRKGAKALAFEPNQVVFYRLRANISRNKTKVHHYMQALSDKAETRDFWTKHEMTSAGRFRERSGAKKVTVDCVTIDSLKACRSRVAAIKIDVEGAEMAVLRGADMVLRRDHPLVVAEALTDAARQALVLHMTGLGYNWRSADGRNLVFFT